MDTGPHLTEPSPRRPSAVPSRLRADNAAVLTALWVAVIVLAVAVDLVK